MTTTTYQLACPHGSVVLALPVDVSLREWRAWEAGAWQRLVQQTDCRCGFGEVQVRAGGGLRRRLGGR